MLSHKDLYNLVDEHISRRILYPFVDGYNEQLARSQFYNPVSTSGLGKADVINAMMGLLVMAVPPRIKTGLNVEALDPETAQVKVTPGVGFVGGYQYNLQAEKTIDVPFDDTISVFYVTLYSDGIKIETSETPLKLTVAKIIVPEPGTTSIVKDKRDVGNPWDAFIVNRREYRLFGDANGNLEEDSIDLLRDNIGDILADNIIGNIRLNEDLKIINTSGTLELDSESLKIYDATSNLLAKFNKDGVYFFDTNGNETAHFGVIDARIGNILITQTTVQSANYVEDVTGFRIRDDGNAEFNDVKLRGTLYASIIEENITIGEGVMFIGDMNFADNIAIQADNKVLFDGINGDTYWTYNSSTTYLECWVDGIKRMEL